MKKGFTLIELLISIIIILLIVASFIPIMSKKMTKTLKSTTETKIIEPQGEIFIPFDGSSEKKGNYFECEKAQENILTCAIKNIPSPYINAVLVGGGGGGGGASKMTLKKNYIQTITSSNFYTNFTSNVTLNLYAPGGGGGGGFYGYKTEEEQKFLEGNCPAGTEAIKVGTGLEYCVTKYNLRPTNYNEYHKNSADGTKFEENSATQKEIKVAPDITFNTENKLTGDDTAACWISASKNCTNGTGDYPACGRTVCTYSAASAMCKALTLGGNNCRDNEGNAVSCKGRWRLATNDELRSGTAATSEAFLKGIFQNSYAALNDNSKNSIELCSSYSSYLPYCATDSSSCYDSANGCKANYIWGNGYSGSVTTSYSGYSYSTSTNALSVRCVLEKSLPRFSTKAYSGGGGGAGASITNLVVPQDLIDNCNNSQQTCYINFSFPTVATAGNGISTDTSVNSDIISADNGGDGKEIYVYLRTGGNYLWGYKVEGGKGGKGATTDGPGDGGEGGKLCYKIIPGTSLVWSSPFECETIKENGTGHAGNKGSAGDKYEIENESYSTINVAGGLGGSGYSSTQNSGAKGGSAIKGNSNNGQTGTKYLYNIKYDMLYKAASAGGGGGGSFVQINNIRVPKNKKFFDVQIGGGGTAGKAQTETSQTNGGNGADTYIGLDSNLYYTAPGGKGGTKGVSDTGYSTRTFGTGGQKGEVPEKIIRDNQDATAANGTEGGNAKAQDDIKENGEPSIYLSIGGLGGKSGISVTQRIVLYAHGCPGLFNDANLGCENQNNANALVPLYLSSKHPEFDFKNGYYGSYGAGGGGGGWKYDEATGEEQVGNGAAGQGGYIYIWW